MPIGGYVGEDGDHLGSNLGCGKLSSYLFCAGVAGWRYDEVEEGLGRWVVSDGGVDD